MRKHIFDLLYKEDSCIGHWYSALMFLFIVASLVPLAFRGTNLILNIVEQICVVAFIVDYLLRWLTADMHLGKGAKSFLFYPFTAMALIDLLSIMPAFTVVSDTFVLFRLTRLVRILRILKITRYSKELELFLKVLYEQRSVLLSVIFLAFIYIVFTALIMFNVDEQFDNFFEALYWATTALTTVGYGDVCPHNDVGRLISMASSLVGVAVIALPSGVITASYLKAIEEFKQKGTQEGE